MYGGQRMETNLFLGRAFSINQRQQEHFYTHEIHALCSSVLSVFFLSSIRRRAVFNNSSELMLNFDHRH